ncbi:hypothetical protein L873DRAFT_29203 [Choiromyces venosus 120613-1]|uniref:Uncharacterized protein n=1 Tax=Choiromyces venosus 120613-1 TaxID=1336337 RepID=A0A3N4K6J2_9PEZI|nr:hypothetical protein L873DRAFT_29203 [Choiromyces venosus 120613-1]
MINHYHGVASPNPLFSLLRTTFFYWLQSHKSQSVAAEGEIFLSLIGRCCAPVSLPLCGLN